MLGVYCMAQDAIIVTGIEQQLEALKKMQTDNPATKKALQAIIRRSIAEARKNVVKDARDVLENDPRHAYKAVRNSVYKQIFGGQINILSSRKRGSAANYRKQTTSTAGQRGGNRRPRSLRTMQLDSYEGADRGFILRFINAGTSERKIEFNSDSRRELINRGARGGNPDKYGKTINTGSRGKLRIRDWFGRSSAFQLDAAANRVAEEIETLLQQEFQMM